MTCDLIKLKDRFHIYDKEMLCFLINEGVSLNFITKNYDNLYIIRNCSSEVQYLGYLIYYDKPECDDLILEFLN